MQHTDGERHPPGILRGAWLVLRKDLTIETKTQESLLTVGFFSVLLVVLSALAFTHDASMGQEAAARAAPGALWLAIAFAAVLTLGQSFQREREESAFTSLLSSPLPRASIFLGKAIAIFVTVAAIECLLVPLVGLFFHIDLLPLLPTLLPLLFLGTLGACLSGTLFGALTVQTRARELVLSAILFPLFAPALLSGVLATRELVLASLAGQTLAASELSDYVLLLVAFDGVALFGGIALFGPLIDGA